MKITNKWGLPEPLVRAVGYSDYNKEGADFSVTELIKPARIVALEHHYDDEIEEDASDRLWMLMGSSGHEVLRRSSDGGLVEQRCVVDFEQCKISGQLDYAVTEKEIIDYKFVSLWAVKDGVKPEWEQQLNIYKWMAEQYGVLVDELKIIAILRDWNKSEAWRNRNSPDFPQSQVMVLPVRIWTTEQVEAFVRGRIAAHIKARTVDLPLCTAEEMWERPERYAVKKKGNIKATRVLDTKEDAIKDLVGRGSGYEIEVRPAERPRCENYCSVSEFCEQFKQWKGQQK